MSSRSAGLRPPGGPFGEGQLEVLQRKGLVLMLVLTMAIGVLVARLALLQLQRGDHYLVLARDQLVRIVKVPAPRGKILDRSGIPLATNRPSFTASLVYTGKPLASQEVSLLSQILNISPDVIRAADAQRRQGRPYEPVRLKTDLTPQEATLLEEERVQLPGVVVQADPMRLYPGLGDQSPGQQLAAHVLGYVSKGDSPIDVVGKYGIEASYDGSIKVGGKSILGLSGVDGTEQVEVDHLGRPVRYVGGDPPQPGNDVVLTIDAHIQDVAQRALAANLVRLRTHHFFDGGPFPAPQGAVVVEDPRNGQILALASEPSFDPNDFARAADVLPGTPAWNDWQKEWQALSDPKTVGRPLIDHAISDLSPPGSTFKPITSLAALVAGTITPDEHVPCPPYIMVGSLRKSNWVSAGGNLNLYQALGRSCDTYYYRVGAATGIDRIEAMARSFGLGEPTGQTALAGEQPGFLAGPDTKKRLGYKDPWYVSETMDAAIGQGFDSFNVLEVANYVATLANGGTRYRPYFVQQLRDPSGKVLADYRPEALSHVDIPPADLAAVRQAMVGVTEYHPDWSGQADAPFGTAYVLFQDWLKLSQQYTGHEIHVAAKTGTAELNGQVPNGWFICFAPAENPVVAIAVYVREADEGVLSGAPVARAILGQIFGVPDTSEQLLFGGGSGE